MKFEIGTTNYEVKFYRRKGTSKGENLITTACHIVVMNGESFFGKGDGFAEQSPKDNHSKKVGRKVALAHALKNYNTYHHPGISKQQRAKLWKQYSKQCRLV